MGIGRLILISHRGNIDKINRDYENNPDYIMNAIKKNFLVDIDLWNIKGNLYLGHDEPQWATTTNFIDNPNFYIHCKNESALEYLSSIKLFSKYFWHQSDEYTIVSNGIVWVHQGKKLLKNSICCLPEQGFDGNLEICFGICSDYIDNYLPLLDPR